MPKKKATLPAKIAKVAKPDIAEAYYSAEAYRMRDEMRKALSPLSLQPAKIAKPDPDIEGIVAAAVAEAIAKLAIDAIPTTPAKPAKPAKIAQQPEVDRQPLSLAELQAMTAADARAELWLLQSKLAMPAKIAKVAKPAKVKILGEVGEDGRTPEQRARWIESTTACALCPRRYRGGKGMAWHLSFIHAAATPAELKRAAKAVDAADARLDEKALARADSILAARKMRI